MNSYQSQSLGLVNAKEILLKGRYGYNSKRERSRTETCCRFFEFGSLLQSTHQSMSIYVRMYVIYRVVYKILEKARKLYLCNNREFFPVFSRIGKKHVPKNSFSFKVFYIFND